jgi:uncharacterized protein (TIGR02145 family)
MSCIDIQNEKETDKKKNKPMVSSTRTTIPVSSNTIALSNTIIDSRDGEIYKIVTIGKQTWLAENLRFNASESMTNPLNPSKKYGRLYDLIPAQTACPAGWHLPTDAEWDTLEIAHGMPVSFIGQGGWRGEHATNMKAKMDWKDGESGRDSLGFKVLPAGYYFSEATGIETPGLEGLGYAAAFWSAIENEVGYARFMFGERTFVNKWDAKREDIGTALSCRCVKD